MAAVSSEAAHKHRIPVIDRMMEVLAQLEQREGGATIRDLVVALKLPRTTVYRILNSLQLHDVVRRDANGVYQLGQRLLRLASHVATGSSEADVIEVAQPYLDRTAAQLGEGCKLSVLDSQGVLVIATAQGRSPYALSVAPGQRQAAHAGAASRVLLAHLPEPALKRWLDKPLPAFTARTFADSKKLKAELTRVKRLGWAQDRGEAAISIHAFAAPIIDGHGNMIAAISVPFLAGTEANRMEEIRLSVLATAKELSAALP